MLSEEPPGISGAKEVISPTSAVTVPFSTEVILAVTVVVSASLLSSCAEELSALSDDVTELSEEVLLEEHPVSGADKTAIAHMSAIISRVFIALTSFHIVCGALPPLLIRFYLLRVKFL